MHVTAEPITREDRAHEARLRRLAERQGLRLTKSRRRDPQFYDFGVFWVSDPYTNSLLSSEYGMNIDEVEAYLEAASAPE
jgi:hypothetical protein